MGSSLKSDQSVEVSDISESFLLPFRRRPLERLLLDELRECRRFLDLDRDLERERERDRLRVLERLLRCRWRLLERLLDREYDRERERLRDRERPRDLTKKK